MSQGRGGVPRRGPYFQEDGPTTFDVVINVFWCCVAVLCVAGTLAATFVALRLMWQAVFP